MGSRSSNEIRADLEAFKNAPTRWDLDDARYHRLAADAGEVPALRDRAEQLEQNDVVRNRILETNRRMREAAEAERDRLQRAVAAVERLHRPDFETERRYWKDSVSDDEVRERAKCLGCSNGITFTRWSDCRTRAALADAEARGHTPPNVTPDPVGGHSVGGNDTTACSHTVHDRVDGERVGVLPGHVRGSLAHLEPCPEQQR